MLRILVEPEVAGELVADRLDQVDHVEQARELEANDVASLGHRLLVRPAGEDGPHKVTQAAEQGPAGGPAALML